MSIQLKRGLTANIDPEYILKDGQVGIEKLRESNSSAWYPYIAKVGDGTTPWKNLSYICTPHIYKYIERTGTVSISPPEIDNGYGDRIDSIVMDSASISLTSRNRGTSIRSVCSDFSGDEYEGVTLTAWGSATDLDIVDLKLTLSSNYSSSFYPFQYQQSNTTGTTLGKSGHPWKAVYATNGTIQTSDRQYKHSIHYLDEPMQTISDDSSVSGQSTIGLEDVIEFVQDFRPATFVYNGSAEDDADQIQLGVIANDVENTKLFPYIGSRHFWEAVDAKYDDEGNEIRPAQEGGSSLSIKPTALATAALTCCKYLLQRISVLEESL